MIGIILILLLGVWAFAYLNKKNEDDSQAPAYVDQAVEKESLIMLESPQPNDVVESPLILKGRARGSWFFEASFPVELRDDNGAIIAQGQATATGDWMTEEFVPFTATLSFNKAAGTSTGNLILRKANASGLPENEGALEIPIIFGE